MVKVEYGEPVPLHAAELHFLRSQVRELEREKAELLAENHRLNNMLVHGESHVHMFTADQSQYSTSFVHSETDNRVQVRKYTK